MSGGRAPLGEVDRTDEERFWELFGPSFRAVYRFLLPRCDKPTAEDLTQEVFLDLARRFRRGDDIEALTTGWLITVARSRLGQDVVTPHGDIVGEELSGEDA